MDTPPHGLERRELLGFFAHPGTLEDYLAFTRTTIEGGEKKCVLYHNLHSLYSYFTSADLYKDYQGSTVLVDGMPVIWLMQLFRIPVSREHRLTYVDFIMPLMQQAAEHQWSVFHIGQQSQIQNAALERIRSECPGVRIAGHDGYFDLTPHCEESLAVVEAINTAGTQLLLVGFGAPKQEAWLAAHRHLIHAPIAFTCGACMEYVAGHVKTPPRWMGKLGLEWAFRLMENPRRFAFRYLVEPLILGVLLLRNAVGLWRPEKQSDSQ